VQLRGLAQQQAVVGLLQRRGQVRQQAQPAAEQQQVDLGDKFNIMEAERLRSSLSKADSENLDYITERLIDVQELAAGSPAQLVISMPRRGRMLKFDRPLQVNPHSEMLVSFAAKRPVETRKMKNVACGVGLAVGLFLALTVVTAVSRAQSRLKAQEAEDSAEQSAALPGRLAADGGEAEIDEGDFDADEEDERDEDDDEEDDEEDEDEDDEK